MHVFMCALMIYNFFIMPNIDSLDYLGVGYGCAEPSEGRDVLSHLCYGSRSNHTLSIYNRQPGCGSAPSAPCPKMSELLKRPACHGCEEYAKPTGAPVNPRDYFAHQTARMTGSKTYGAAATKPCAGCSAPAPAMSASAKKVMDHEHRSKPILVEGRLVDMRCYSMDLRNYGQDHVTAEGKVLKGCATACAKSGIPVGLLTGGGAPGNRVYVLLTAAPQLADQMNRMARVEGRLMNDSGCILTEKIEVKNQVTKQYEEVNVNTPM